MNNTTLPLSDYAHIAINALEGKGEDHLVIIPFYGHEPLPLIVSTMQDLPERAILRDVIDMDRALGLLFLKSGRTADDYAEDIARCDAFGSSLCPNWDLALCWGGVRFAVRAGDLWLDEPETDRQSNDDLDAYMSLMDVPVGPASSKVPSRDDVCEAMASWRSGLQREFAGHEAGPAPFLSAGAVRDSVIVWAIGRSGYDTFVPGSSFVPPHTPPDPMRIKTAITVLSRSLSARDGKYALGCIAYLAWWCGWNRLAWFAYWKARGEGHLTRLTSLVHTALIQEVKPPWMS